MKIKSIIVCGMLLLGVGAATTSCEDMFTAENNLVSTNLAPQDTLFQMMGIIKKMQVLADRTILLGEVRADLVDVDPIHATADVQQLGNNKVSTDNIYNQPSDYYAVINNCNIYLAGVDSLLKSHGEYYFEKEICAVKSFRAWCYLELAKIYGEVPFVIEPVLSSSAAEEIVASGTKADMKTILDFCIQDLSKYPDMNINDDMRQIYGGADYAGFSLQQMFIPVRPLLAELYLWRGSFTGNRQDYIDAIGLYHDYFCFPKEERGLSSSMTALTQAGSVVYISGSAVWTDRNFNRRNESYTNRFAGSSYESIGVLPLDTVEYFGNVSDIRSVFNSQYANDYYPAVSPSERMKSISRNQDYCKYINSFINGEVLYGSHNSNDYTDKLMEGDLRLYSVYNNVSNLAESQYNSNVNAMKSYIAKYTNGSSTISTDVKQAFIAYFRIPILYLHLAEALNRAGFPETAFAVLKYGLSYDVMNDRSIISQEEFDRLCAIKTRGYSLVEPTYQGDIATQTAGSFVIWPSTAFFNIDRNRTDASQYIRELSDIRALAVGVHSLGCGESEYNDKYYLDDSLTLKELVAVPLKPVAPDTTLMLGDSLSYEDWCAVTGTKVEALKKYDDYAQNYSDYPERYAAYVTDSTAYEKAVATNIAYLASDAVRAKRQAHVKQLILDEEALEGAFEGKRFFDLLRYQMQEGKVSGKSAAITLPDYIVEKYGSMEKDNMTGKPWYLTLPNR